MSAVYLQQLPSYSNHNCKKIVIFTYPGLHFLFALGTPLWQLRKTLHEWKDNSVLANPSEHVPIYLQQFPSYSNRKCKKSLFSRTAANIFVSPGDAPDYHAICCIDGKTIQCLINHTQHVPIYLPQCPRSSNRKCKKSPFSRTAAHIFVSPGDTPAIITQYVAWVERQFNACQTPRSMYLSIFNSFRVIRS